MPPLFDRGLGCKAGKRGYSGSAGCGGVQDALCGMCRWRVAACCDCSSGWRDKYTGKKTKRRRDRSGRTGVAIGVRRVSPSTRPQRGPGVKQEKKGRENGGKRLEVKMRRKERPYLKVAASTNKVRGVAELAVQRRVLVFVLVLGHRQVQLLQLQLLEQEVLELVSCDVGVGVGVGVGAVG